MDPLLTRRQTLQSLAFSATFGGSLLNLVGCGGGGHHGGGAGAGTQTVRVPVEVPAGFTLPVADMQAGTAFGTGSVASGASRLRVNDETATFAFLRHKPSGRFVLFGLVGSGRPGITPLSTAVAAMALYFGWTGYVGAARAQVLALLERDASVQALGEAIAGAIAADPYAVTSGNAAVQAAMKATIEALRAGSAAQIVRAAKAAALRADDAPLVQVQPSDEQSGARVDQGDAGKVVPTNLKRRPVSFYTYLVGHGPAASSAIARVDQQDVLPTGTFLGQIASMGERPASAPVAAKPVGLPVSGSDDKTLYETVALMGTFDNAPAEPAFFSDGKYAGEVAAWRAKLEELRVYSCFHSVGADVFNAAALGGGGVLYYAAAQEIRAQIALIASDAAALVIARAVGGGYGEYLQGLMEAISEEYYKFYTAGSTAWRRVGLRLAGLAESAAEEAALGEAGATLASIAFLTAAALAAAGTALSVLDLGASAIDTYGSPLGVRWTETALKPKVRISPDEATIKAGASQTFSAALVGLGGSTGVTYRWSVAGSDLANLSDGKGKIGASFDTDSNTVNLATTPSTQGPLTVSVEAFRNGDSLGTDKATVSFGDGLTWQSATYAVYTFPGDYGNVGVVPYVSVGTVGGATAYFVRARGAVFGDNEWHTIVGSSVGGAYPNPPEAAMSPYDARGYKVASAVLLSYAYKELQYVDHPVPPTEADALVAQYASTYGKLEYQWSARTA